MKCLTRYVKAYLKKSPMTFASLSLFIRVIRSSYNPT